MDKTKRISMPELDPSTRNRHFGEVACGYTQDMAIQEAYRCLNCKTKPCVQGCPVNVQIPEFITQLAEGKVEQAYTTITATNALPAICGRVCPQESQCEKYCVRGVKGESVAIGRLERYVADTMTIRKAGSPNTPAPQNTKVAPTQMGKRVAVVGSGPSGLACAGDLADRGYQVTVFEAFHTLGGVLVYGIPEFRLPKAVVASEIEGLRQKGVVFETNSVIGKTHTLDELMEELGYQAVYIASGAGLPNFMSIPGENLNGVYSANEFLTRINLMKAHENSADTPVMRGRAVAVIGGGNVAMDAARCAKRLGAEIVMLVYRRGEEEMPARLEEVHHAKEEGIILCTLTNPVAIIDDGNGWVSGLSCQRMSLSEPDASGRRKPVAIEGSLHTIEADCVVMAIGQSPNPLITRSTPDLETNRYGCIAADETGKTSKSFVYAGGDVVTGAATVILAMGAGKKAAEAIDQTLHDLRSMKGESICV